MKRPLKQILLQQKPNPERGGKHPLGDELRRYGCCNNAGVFLAITRRLVPFSLVNATANNDLPLDLLGILATRKIPETLAAFGTTTFCFRQFTDLFDAGKIHMTLSAMACGSRLLAPLASFVSWWLRLVVAGGVGRPGVRWFLGRLMARRGRVAALFRSPPEHLPSQVDNLGFQCFNLLVLLSDLLFMLSLLLTQLSDLGVQLADRGLQLSYLGFQRCFALDRTSMLGLPEVRLLTQFDQPHAVDVFRDDRHTTMVGDRALCVLRPASRPPPPLHIGRTSGRLSEPAWRPLAGPTPHNQPPKKQLPLRPRP